MPTMTLKRFAAHIAHCARAQPVLERIALAEAADDMAETARGYIGEYQGPAPPFPAWSPLAESTIEDRVRQGYTPDDPLLREGDLRASIGGFVQGRSAVVASNSRVALWQEMGTATIPPRASIGRAVAQRGREMARRVAYISLRPLLTGRP